MSSEAHSPASEAPLLTTSQGCKPETHPSFLLPGHGQKWGNDIDLSCPVHGPLRTWNIVDVTEYLNFKFYLILINLHWNKKLLLNSVIRRLLSTFGMSLCEPTFSIVTFMRYKCRSSISTENWDGCKYKAHARFWKPSTKKNIPYLINFLKLITCWYWLHVEVFWVLWVK